MSLEQVTEAGRPATDDEAMLVRVQREDFSIDEELRRVRARSKRIGGIAIFLGTARDRSKGKDVDGITFEHYEGMAQKKLREIVPLRQDEIVASLLQGHKIEPEDLRRGPHADPGITLPVGDVSSHLEVGTHVHSVPLYRGSVDSQCL